ncbi:MAG: hypothetical protein Q9157_005393 [Trypethelium eluteriae]
MFAGKADEVEPATRRGTLEQRINGSKLKDRMVEVRCGDYAVYYMLQHQQRLIEKLANTAETSFAQHAPDQNHIQLQTKMNNQAKVRPSTRSSNPDEVEVTSYADLEGTRAKRAEKDPAKVVKGDGRRGRKGKSVAQELDTTEPEPNTLVQIDMTLVAEDAFRPEPWRAFVPRIW